MSNFIDQLKEFIEISKTVLESTDIEEVEHYFNHREYEMAFEGLLIELSKKGVYPTEFNFREWKALGEHLNLHRESVFNGNIWTTFFEWGMASLDTKSVVTKEDLIDFIRNLKRDLNINKENWENITLEDYIESISAWLNDVDSLPDQPEWKTIAELLLSGKYYE